MIKKLMHKNTEVCTLKFKNDDIVECVKDVSAPELVFGEENASAFVKRGWYLREPYGRRDIAEIRQFYSSSRIRSKTRRSLFDCYWIKDSDEQTWESVSPYSSYDPDDDAIFLALVRPEEFEGFMEDSPNLTIPGKSRRFWYRGTDGKLCMLYGSAQREMSVKKEAVKLGCDDILAPREYMFLREDIFVVSPAQTSEDVEMVPFTYLYESVEDPGAGMLDNVETTCEYYGLKGWEQFFSKMSTLDKSTEKTQREFWEVGVLRDANTLKYTGFALL